MSLSHRRFLPPTGYRGVSRLFSLYRQMVWNFPQPLFFPFSFFNLTSLCLVSVLAWASITGTHFYSKPFRHMHLVTRGPPDLVRQTDPWEKEIVSSPGPSFPHSSFQESQLRWCLWWTAPPRIWSAKMSYVLVDEMTALPFSVIIKLFSFQRPVQKLSMARHRQAKDPEICLLRWAGTPRKRLSQSPSFGRLLSTPRRLNTNANDQAKMVRSECSCTIPNE